MFFSVTQTFTGRSGGGGELRKVKDLDVRVGILGQNQNNALRKHILLMLIIEHEEKNVPQWKMRTNLVPL